MSRFKNSKELIEYVKTCDKEAGEYLECEAPLLKSFYPWREKDGVEYGLGGLFAWSESRQGHEFWSEFGKMYRCNGWEKDDEEVTK